MQITAPFHLFSSFLIPSWSEDQKTSEGLEDLDWTKSEGDQIMEGAKNGTEVVKQTFLEHLQTLFGKDELYFFGWFAVIIFILLICVACVGCRACCCRACCFARETRTQLYMCKVPQTSKPFCKGIQLRQPVSTKSKCQHPHHSCAIIDPCTCNHCSHCTVGKIKHNHEVAALPACHHPHHCAAADVDPCTCNHCLHCAVQPHSKTKVDKATNTGPGSGPTRVGFEHVHSAAAPMGWHRPDSSSASPVRNTSSVYGTSTKRRAPEPPGFRYPPGSWSYHKPNAPTAAEVDEAVTNNKPAPSTITNTLNNNKPAPVTNVDDEDWD